MTSSSDDVSILPVVTSSHPWLAMHEDFANIRGLSAAITRPDMEDSMRGLHGPTHPTNNTHDSTSSAIQKAITSNMDNETTNAVLMNAVLKQRLEISWAQVLQLQKEKAVLEWRIAESERRNELEKRKRSSPPAYDVISTSSPRTSTTFGESTKGDAKVETTNSNNNAQTHLSNSDQTTPSTVASATKFPWPSAASITVQNNNKVAKSNEEASPPKTSPTAANLMHSGRKTSPLDLSKANIVQETKRNVKPQSLDVALGSVTPPQGQNRRSSNEGHVTTPQQETAPNLSQQGQVESIVSPPVSSVAAQSHSLEKNITEYLKGMENNNNAAAPAFPLPGFQLSPYTGANQPGLPGPNCQNMPPNSQADPHNLNAIQNHMVNAVYLKRWLHAAAQQQAHQASMHQLPQPPKKRQKVVSNFYIAYSIMTL